MKELASRFLLMSTSEIAAALADIESSIASPPSAEADVERTLLHFEGIYVRLCDLRMQPCISPTQLARCAAAGNSIRRWIRAEIDKVVGVHREESQAARLRAAKARDELGQLQVELIAAQKLADAAKKIVDSVAEKN